MPASPPPLVIAPSILSADLARLGADVRRMLDAGGDWVHVDVMDNHYVPNLTFGPMVCRALRDYGIEAPMDVHLMAEPVDRLIPDFAAAGANRISVHPEASAHLDRTLGLIVDQGCTAGVVLNPATPIGQLDWVMHRIDLILVMSVNPGFGGQHFLRSVLPKIRAVRERIDASGHDVRLCVDGGVNLATIAEAAAAGADTFVAGSAVFGAPDYASAISGLRAAAEAGRPGLAS